MTLMQPSCKSKARDTLTFYQRIRTDTQLQHEQHCSHRQCTLCVPGGLKSISASVRSRWNPLWPMQENRSLLQNINTVTPKEATILLMITAEKSSNKFY